MEENRKQSFVMYASDIYLFRTLEPDEFPLLIEALFSYAETGNIPNLDNFPRAKNVFNALRHHIDIDNSRYAERCARNRANIQKRWHNQDAESETE